MNTCNILPVNKHTAGILACGIDFGTNTAAAFSDGADGYFIENPRWFKQALPKIKKASRDKRRKRAPNYKKQIKASRRWKRATKKVGSSSTLFTSAAELW